MPVTVAEAVRMCKLQLDSVVFEESLQQAKLLVGFTLGIDERALQLHHQMELSREQIIELGEYILRRTKGEPLQYILGQWSFMGLTLGVDARALIPRQDTETLVETALAYAKQRGYKRVLDLCCGNGCIGIALAVLAKLEVLAVDISQDCIDLTQENASLNGANIRTQRSDLFNDIIERFDMIVCNPPYLSKADMEDLQTELRFEPKTALYGGFDGLDFFRRICKDYTACLEDDGMLLIEIGASQAEDVTQLFRNAKVLADACDLPRIVIVEGT